MIEAKVSIGDYPHGNKGISWDLQRNLCGDDVCIYLGTVEFINGDPPCETALVVIDGITMNIYGNAAKRFGYCRNCKDVAQAAYAVLSSYVDMRRIVRQIRESRYQAGLEDGRAEVAKTIKIALGLEEPDQ